MKLHMGDTEAMLCADALRHLGDPRAIAIEYDPLTGDIYVRPAQPGTDRALDVSRTDRFGYEGIAVTREPVIDPGCYRLNDASDGSLIVDPHRSGT